MKKWIPVGIVLCILGTTVAISQPLRRNSNTSHSHSHNHVKISERGNFRYIESNGIPDHIHGQFPNKNNPNRISPQSYKFRVPLEPMELPLTASGRGYLSAVGLNGIPFDPGTAEFWKRDRSLGWNYSAISKVINLGLDSNHAHVQPTGAYHYHGLPTGLIAKKKGKNEMTLVGYAADGFPLYNQYGYSDPKDSKSKLKEMKGSYQLKRGTRPGGSKGPGGKYDGTFDQDWEYVEDSGDLDKCNGRFGVTPEHPEGIYHYYVTNTFPYIMREFKGVPDDSFQKHRGGRHGRGGPPGGGPPNGRRPPPPGR